MTSRNLSIDESNLLLVEGPDDLRVFGALMTHMNIAGIQIIPMEGISNLRSVLIPIRCDHAVYWMGRF